VYWIKQLFSPHQKILKGMSRGFCETHANSSSCIAIAGSAAVIKVKFNCHFMFHGGIQRRLGAARVIRKFGYR
jgi:hypothetical protein